MNMRGICALLAVGALAGCASFSTDGGQNAVRALAEQRIGPQPGLQSSGRETAVEQRVAELLAAPLSAQDAVTVALLNNRGLRAAYAQLGIAEADLVQAGRLANPAFTFSRLKGPDGIDIERKLMLPVLGLLVMPLAREAEQQRFEQAQLRTAGDVLRVADETRRAWYTAVAAAQTASYMEQVQTAAQASAELAARMVKAGNWSALQQAREQAFLGEAKAQLTRARQAHIAAREKLTRLMGLSTPSFQLPERLPDLPATPRQASEAEAQAMANRLDLLAGQKELAGLAKSLGLARTTRFVNLLELGYRRDSAAGQRSSGYEISLEVPLFDWGGARVARAEAIYTEALQRTAGLAIDARSQVREAVAAEGAAFEVARQYRDEIVPLKKRISDEQLLRYNGMLIGVFELLADAREQVASVNGAIEAQRDFWLADAALQAALTGAAPH
jgi:outer membrane protein TolC